jgi:hypothetical protein
MTWVSAPWASQPAQLSPPGRTARAQARSEKASGYSSYGVSASPAGSSSYSSDTVSNHGAKSGRLIKSVVRERLDACGRVVLDVVHHLTHGISRHFVRAKRRRREVRRRPPHEEPRIASSYRASLPTTKNEWTELKVPLADFRPTAFGRPVFRAWGRSSQARSTDRIHAQR